MAVDTRNKRFSMMGLNGPYRAVLPNPDGGFSIQGDRQQLIYLYAGFSSSGITSRRGVRVMAPSQRRRATVPTDPDQDNDTGGAIISGPGKIPAPPPFIPR